MFESFLLLVMIVGPVFFVSWLWGGEDGVESALLLLFFFIPGGLGLLYLAAILLTAGKCCGA